MSDLLALCYHAVSPTWTAALSVQPSQLERQLEILAERGYRSVGFSEAIQAPPSRKTLVITFDDAYRSVLELGLPILERFGFVATVFAPTSFVGSETPMSWPGIDHWLGGAHERELMPLSWPELQQLVAAGWEVGSHTSTHPRLTRLGAADLQAELEGSRSACEEGLGGPCRALAYPYGDHDERVVTAAARAGYTAACTLPAGWHRPQPLSWPRLGIYNGDGEMRFRLKVSRSLRWLRTTPGWELLARMRKVS